MKILWFTNVPMPDVHTYFSKETKGSGGWMGALLEKLKNEVNIHIGVITASTEYPDIHISKDGVDYYIINQKRIPMRPSILPVDDNPKYLKKCLRLIEEFNPDLIHIHGTERFYGNLISNQLINIPAVISVQGILTHCSKWFHWFGHLSMIDVIRFDFFKTITFRGQIWEYVEMKKRAIREQKIMASCDCFFGRTFWDKSYVSFYNKKANYFHEDRIIRKAFWNKIWDIKKCKRHRIVFTNASHPRKGVKLLLDAVKKLKNEYVDIELLLIGELGNSGYANYIKRIINKMDGHVKLLGGMNEYEIAEELKSSHLFVSASYIDNSPNSLAEAQIVGMPVIASYTGGVPSMIEHGITGLLFSVGDEVDLCGRIREVFSDDYYATTLAANALSQSRKRHSSEIIVRSVLNGYESIINKK